VNKLTKSSIYETWTKVDNNEFYGMSYALNAADTVIFETVRLVQKNDSLFYIVTTKNQNNSLPVTFRSKNLFRNHLAFANPAHDFPQMITYTLITQDSLVAEISGMTADTLRSKKFPMRKIK
jgi:hypothetical protein